MLNFPDVPGQAGIGTLSLSLSVPGVSVAKLADDNETLSPKQAGSAVSENRLQPLLIFPKPCSKIFLVAHLDE